MYRIQLQFKNLKICNLAIINCNQRCISILKTCISDIFCILKTFFKKCIYRENKIEAIWKTVLQENAWNVMKFILCKFLYNNVLCLIFNDFIMNETIVSYKRFIVFMISRTNLSKSNTKWNYVKNTQIYKQYIVKSQFFLCMFAKGNINCFHFSDIYAQEHYFFWSIIFRTSNRPKMYVSRNEKIYVWAVCAQIYYCIS